jgi:membrane associated rhomboid family serine protease
MNDINYQNATSQNVKTVPDNIEVWEDLVNIRSLVLSLFICSITAIGGYFIAPNEAPKPLFFGLSGALIGFIICSFLVNPKRNIHEIHKED